MSRALPALEKPKDWHRRVWLLAGPIMLSNASQPLLGAVDTAVVGRLPDPAHIGGVALGSVIFSFLLWCFGFLRMSTTAFAAQAHGAEDRPEMTAVLGRSLIIAAIAGLAMIALQTPIAWIAFQVIGGSEKVESLATLYYDIRIWSVPASLFTFAITGWLIACQHTVLTFVLTIFLNGLNIILDFWFVVGFEWGVAGVAWATLMAELATVVLGLYFVWRVGRAEGLKLSTAGLIQREKLLILLRANRDIFIRTLCLLIAFSYFTLRSAEMGDDLLAANTILMHFFAFASSSLDGFAYAVEALAGASVGAKNRAALRRAVVVSGLWCQVAGILLAVIFGLGGTAIIGLFTTIEEVRLLANSYLLWIVALPIISASSFLLDGIYIGASWNGPMRNAMIFSLACYGLAIWLLVPLFANEGLWLSIYVLMVARSLSLGLFYKRLEGRIPVKA